MGNITPKLNERENEFHPQRSRSIEGRRGGSTGLVYLPVSTPLVYLGVLQADVR